MKILGAAITLTVSDPAASSEFFCTHLGFHATVTNEDFTYLERDDLDVEIVLRHRDPERSPATAGPGPSGVQLSFDVPNLAAEQDRLLDEDAPVTTPLRREAGGLLRLRLTDPNQVDVQLTQWAPPAGY
ncbi:VOC family protein [Nocardia tengchongensis]|uniref:VOC family protein n=1 Tax=Nocardia tengchongensis TaxID=2055889 RepID=UPI003613E051